MSHTYHTSLSGMLAASFGLQNASNNIANMQSPGFKKSDVFYACLGSGGQNRNGSGVGIGGSAVNFSPGKCLPGNTSTDLAIVGQGFFIIKMKNGELLYTRNGEFAFNEQGVLTDRHSQGEVQGYDAHSNLVSIREKGPDICPGKPTETLWLNGQFIPVEKTQQEKDADLNPLKNNYKNIEFTIDNVYDSEGKAHTLKLIFESSRSPHNLNDDGTSWELLYINCDDATVKTGFNKPLVFSSSGFLRSGESTIHCTLNGDQRLSFEFGNYTAGADKSVQLKTKSPENALTGTSIKIFQQDGYAQGKQTRFSMDDNGEISYSYDNGQSLKGHHIALSQFNDLEHTLERANGNLFRAKTTAGRIIGKPNKLGAGSIQTSSLESANIDSTTEFANIVVLQRMFQSCSQIMNIDKELMEALYK